MYQRPTPVSVTAAEATAALKPLQDHIASLLNELDNSDLALIVRSGDRRAPGLMSAYEQNLPDGVYEKPAYDKFENFWRVLLAYQATADRSNDESALVMPWMAKKIADILATASTAKHGKGPAPRASEEQEPARRPPPSVNPEARAVLAAGAICSPAGLRVRADMIKDRLNDSGSCAAHLGLAADRIEQLEAFANFVADWTQRGHRHDRAELSELFVETRRRAIALRGTNAPITMDAA